MVKTKRDSIPLLWNSGFLWIARSTNVTDLIQYSIILIEEEKLSHLRLFKGGMPSRAIRTAIQQGFSFSSEMNRTSTHTHSTSVINSCQPTHLLSLFRYFFSDGANFCAIYFSRFISIRPLPLQAKSFFSPGTLGCYTLYGRNWTFLISFFFPLLSLSPKRSSAGAGSASILSV